MPFTFTRFDEMPDVLLVTPRIFEDDRGWFMETYKHSDFSAAGIPEFVQDNCSRTHSEGVIRGLHYQLRPKDQGKLVRCTRGRIFDVAVDIRPGSPTYGRWIHVELTAENRMMLWVPCGFAHGFQTLTEETEVAYKLTAEYSAPHDRSIRWDCPDTRIDWPIANPRISVKDAQAPCLAQAIPER